MFLSVSGTVLAMGMSEVEAEALAKAITAQRARAFGTKKDAYTAAKVNSGTWDKAEWDDDEKSTEVASIRGDRLRLIVLALWPETHGDWSRVPGVGGATQDRPYVSKTDPTAGSATHEQDDDVLQAVREMRDELRALSERVGRLEDS